MSILLDSHPGIVSVGELDNSIHEYPKHRPYPCSCGRAIDECTFFGRVQENCARQGVELDLQNFAVRLGDHFEHHTRRLIFGSALRLNLLERARDRLLRTVPAYRDYVDRIFDRNVAIAQAIIEASGKDTFLDASKGVTRVSHLIRRPDIDLQIIHVVRDPRAFVWSNLKHERASVMGGTRSWVRTHRAAARLGALVGKKRYFRFRYEDLCGSPEQVLAQICEFLGVEPLDLLPRVDTEPHHVIGNAMRLEPVLPIRPDESWRESLTVQQRRAAERHVGDLARLFGYV